MSKRILAAATAILLVLSSSANASETTGTIGAGGGLIGNSGLSGTVCPSVQALPRPTDLVATPVSTSGINIAWTSSSGATSYRLYRSTDSAFSNDVTKIYDGSSASYSNGGLASATTYYYKVNAVYAACGQSLESPFAVAAVSARTDAAPVVISNSASGAVVTQELVNGGFIQSGGTLVGSNPITLAASGALVVSVRLVSTNAVATSASGSVSASAAAEVSSGTVFTLSGQAYTGTIHPPVFQPVATASSLAATKDIVSVIKVGTDNGSLQFDAPVTLKIPAPGLSAGASVSIDYSLDGITWTSLASDSVEMIDGVPYVVFTTSHFTYFSVGTVLPVCAASDFSIGAWSDCSNGLQSRTVSKLPGASCNSSSSTPATSQSCTMPTSGGGGGGGGGSSGLATSNAVTTTSTGSSVSASGSSALSAIVPTRLPTNVVAVDSPLSTRLDTPGIIRLGTVENVSVQEVSASVTASGMLVLRASSDAPLLAVIPPETRVRSDNGWDGTIAPPVVVNAKDGRVLIQLGSKGHTLSFDQQVSIEVPVALADGSLVDVSVSSDGKNFDSHARGVIVRNGRVSFTTDHFSYFLLREGSETSASEGGTSVLAPQEVSFRDFDRSSFAYDYVIRLSRIGAVNGYPDGTFRPDAPATRAEFLKIALKSLGIAIDTYPSTRFSDVAEPWQASVIETAYTLRIVSWQIGEDGRKIFRPNDRITRAEALKILLAAAKIPVDANLSATSFADVDGWAVAYVEKAKELGIVSGQRRDGKPVFRPNDPITRAEVAKIVVGVMDIPR